MSTALALTSSMSEVPPPCCERLRRAAHCRAEQCDGRELPAQLCAGFGRAIAFLPVAAAASLAGTDPQVPLGAARALALCLNHQRQARGCAQAGRGGQAYRRDHRGRSLADDGCAEYAAERGPPGELADQGAGQGTAACAGPLDAEGQARLCSSRPADRLRAAPQGAGYPGGKDHPAAGRPLGSGRPPRQGRACTHGGRADMGQSGD